MTSHMIVPIETTNQSFHPIIPGVCKATLKNKDSYQMDHSSKILYHDKKQFFYKIQEQNTRADDSSSFSLPTQNRQGNKENAPPFLPTKHFLSKNKITKTLMSPPFPIPYSLTNNEEKSVLLSDEFKQTTNGGCVYQQPFIYEKVLFNSVKYFPDLETAGVILWHSSNVYHRFPSLQKNDFVLPRKYFLSNPPICDQSSIQSTLLPHTSF